MGSDTLCLIKKAFIMPDELKYTDGECCLREVEIRSSYQFMGWWKKEATEVMAVSLDG